MPTAADWLVFIGASTVFAAVPGPGMLYVLARSLHGGRADGIRSTAGNAIGALGHVAAAAVGLSALLAASATAFTAVKLLGAGYLICLGVRTLLGRGHAPSSQAAGAGRSAVVQGMVTELLNPKTAMFFVAFLPHFVHQGTIPVAVVFALLGTIAVSMALGADLLVALLAGSASARLLADARWRGRQRAVSGVAMIGLGGALAIAERG